MEERYLMKHIITTYDDRVDYVEIGQGGVLQMKYSMSMGVKHGKYESFWPNGNLKESGQYVNGNKVGIYRWYNIDGSIKKVHEYDSK